MGNRPGGEMAKRQLQLLLILDASTSMLGEKIESLNFAIRECIQPMRDEAAQNPNAQVMVRALAFSSGAQWHVSQPTDIFDFQWTDLSAGGWTEMGAALHEVAAALDTKKMPDRGIPPVLVLVSDGQPTDDFNAGLKALMDQPWGKKAVRIAIAIGDDADLDVLQKFIGNHELKPLIARNSAELVRLIKWATTVPVKAVSNPATVAKGQQNLGLVPIPAPPVAHSVQANDLW